MMYYNGPSASAQHNGIFSDTTDKELREIGFGLDELITGLEREGFMRCVNLVIVSDHGIAPSYCDQSIFLDDIVTRISTARVFTGPVGRVMFSNKDDQMEATSSLQCRDKKVRALSKMRIPKRYHYANNLRIGGLVLDTKVGTRIALENQNPCLEGDFGYNNLESSMQAIFIAHGPSFKNGLEIDSFRNVEIYNLICQLLDVDPAPNNGTLNSLAYILQESELNQTSMSVADEEFLSEVYKPRPLRKQNAVLGIRGIDDESAQDKCQCDPSESVADPMGEGAESRSKTSPSPIPGTSAFSLLQEKTTLSQPVASLSPQLRDLTEEDVKETSPDPSRAKSSGIAIEVNSSGALKLSSDEKNRESNKTSFQVSNNISEKEKLLDMRNDSVEFANNLLELHAPWGIPGFSAPEVKSDYMNILPHTSHILGFPESLNLPIWSSFTLTRKKLEEVQTYIPTLPEGIEADESDLNQQVPLGCWMADSRLSRPEHSQCSTYLQMKLYSAQNISLRQLFPEELQLPEELSSEGFLLSNLSPVRHGYENGGRNAIIAALKNWTFQYGTVNVVHGPVFDYNFDGKRDMVTEIRNTVKPLTASHFFYVVSFCNKSQESNEERNEAEEISRLKSCIDDIKTYCFIFPNINLRDDCLMSMQEYLLYHLSSLWDVQTLTGIKLYKNLPEEDYKKRLIHQPIKLPYDAK